MESLGRPRPGAAVPVRFRLRGERLLVLALVTLLLFLSALYAVLQKTEEFSPRFFTNTVLLTVLGFVNAILVLALLYILFRDLIRLVAERRRGTLGSQFKTKLVVIFLGLTLIPSILLLVASGKLIEHSLKKWFSPAVDEMVEVGQDILDASSQRYRGEALHFARQVAEDLATDRLLSPSRRRRLRPVMESRLREYHLDLVVVHAGGEAPITVVHSRMSLSTVDALPWELVARVQDGEPAERADEVSGGMVVRAAVAVPGSGEPPAVVSVGYLVPQHLVALNRRLARAAENYLQTKALKSPIQRSYYLILSLVTILVLFASVWVSLALARRITVPIQVLAEGTREVAAGNLDFHLDVDTDDEFGILVDSFNSMTSDLRTAKEGEQRSLEALTAGNRELAERRRYMETLLENISPGVVSMDGEGRVTIINRSACRILDIRAQDNVIGLKVDEVLARPEHRELRDAISEARHGSHGTRERQVTLHAEGRTRTVSAILTPLPRVAQDAPGFIVVLEDVTDLLRAEKIAAWQEVARRLAHEIKNPLTPIQLSAQRIAKKFRQGDADLERVVEEGTEVILSEVRGVQRLLDEFSRFARLPAVQPVAVDLHQVIDQAIALYDGLHPHVTFTRDYHAPEQAMELDPEQMKRVCVNLFDNAIEAMEGRGAISVRTSHLAESHRFRLEISDDGPGIPEGDRERMFLPYFSTKRRGTGLGLAIVNRIIADHHGSVRVEMNEPHGSRIVIDLPTLA
ncbi:MAG: ATP-binding protein [Acidobacteria bacterium]|nr:ATP-binding protein [Acidobacteriota bacterium]